MRVLTFTSLYPSAVRPRHGIFVETKLAAMQRVADVDARVVAPVPWFPFTHRRFGVYGRYASTARIEIRAGLEVFHPRYLTVPQIGMSAQALAMASGASRTIARLNEGFNFDVIDAHYFYPDGVAAAIIARRINKPLVINARGSDVNVLTNFTWPRKMIVWAAQVATAIVTVSAALKDRLVTLGVERGKIDVIRNGVDRERFVPVDRLTARARIKTAIGSPLVLAVGNLVPEKGHELLIEALTMLPEARLIIVGDGPLRPSLVRQIEERGLSNRASILPPMDQNELKWAYGAADLIALTSTREGIPNVLLEALACGRPVVAFPVGGIPEIMTAPLTGTLVTERSPCAMAKAVAELLRAAPKAEEISAFASRFDWSAAAEAQVNVLCRAISAHSLQNATTCHA